MHVEGFGNNLDKTIMYVLRDLARFGKDHIKLVRKEVIADWALYSYVCILTPNFDDMRLSTVRLITIWRISRDASKVGSIAQLCGILFLPKMYRI